MNGPTADDGPMGRFDLTMVSSNNKNCMKVIPSAKSKKQKIVIGDDTGSVFCFGMKKGQANQQFRTPASRKEVSAMAMGGSEDFKDRIYVALGQSIQGLKKKGGEFFQFSTSLNENIKNMFIENVTIWSTCEYIMNTFENAEDAHFYMSPDVINHFCVARATREEYNMVLACRDRNVRVLQDSDLVFETAVDSGVTCVQRMAQDGEEMGGEWEGLAENVVYGLDDGSLGILAMDDKSVRKGWAVESMKRRAGITVMHTMDVNGTGVLDLIVGRDDGTLEIWGLDPDGGEPSVEFDKHVKESITAVDSGFVLSLNSEDIVVSTYSGKVVAFSHEVTGNVAHIQPKKNIVLTKEEKEVDAEYIAMSKESKKERHGGAEEEEKAYERGDEFREKGPEEMDIVIDELRNEIDDLEAALEAEKDKYSSMSDHMIAVERQFKIKSSMKMLPDEACYLISLEIPIPLDVVAVQSTVPAMLLDIHSNMAMVSRTRSDGSDGNHLLVTYRCTESTNRFEIKVRTIEGQTGNLNCYVIPKMSPKTCQKATFVIKPLSLHTKVNPSEIEAVLKKRPLNELYIHGDFTLTEVQAWMSRCLPDIPPRVVGDAGSYSFRNSFLQTVLTAEFSKGKATFSSDNMSTLSMLKEFLTKEATLGKTQIEVEVNLKQESVLRVLHLMKPELDHQYQLTKRHALIEALVEIQNNEEDALKFLSPKYKLILTEAAKIKQGIKVAPRHLDFLRGIVTDLLVHVNRMNGNMLGNKVEKLKQVLLDYNFEKIVKIVTSRD